MKKPQVNPHTQNEPDVAKCDECLGIYRTTWMEGKCPYCEASEAAQSMLSTTCQAKENQKDPEMWGSR